MNGEGEKIKSFEDLGKASNLALMSVEEVAAGSGGRIEKFPNHEQIKITVGGKEYTTKTVWDEFEKPAVKQFAAMSEDAARKNNIDPAALKNFHRAHKTLESELRNIQKREKTGEEISADAKSKLGIAFTTLAARLHELTAVVPAATEKVAVSAEQKESSRAEQKKKEAAITKETMEIARTAAKELLDQKVNLREAFAALEQGLEALKDKEIVAIIDVGGPGKQILRTALNRRLATRGINRKTLEALEARDEVVGFKAANKTLLKLRKEITTYKSGTSPEVILDLVHAYLPSSERFSESLEQYKDENKTAALSPDTVPAVKPSETPILSMSGTATGSFGLGEGILKASVEQVEVPEKKKTFTVPETIGEVHDVLNTIREYTLKAQARGNPAALLSNAQYQEFAVLLAATEKSVTDSKGHGMYGERIDPELAATLPNTFGKLFALSDAIVAFLEGKPAPAEVPAVAAPAEAPKRTELSNETEKLLAQSQAFREQFRGANDLEKGRDENGKWYVKERGKLGEALGAFYTRGLGTKIGSGIRSLFGIRPADLAKANPELYAQKSAALEAARAYSASIEARYKTRLFREVAAGRMTKEFAETRMAQFRSMTANRFVFQTMDIVHAAERKALTDVGGGVFGNISRWYGSLPISGKIAVGTAATAGMGVFAGATAVTVGARASFKAIMISTGLGAVIARKTNDVFVGGAKESVRTTVKDIGANYEARNIEAEQAAYKDSLHTLDRSKTIGVAAGVLVGAGIAGGGTLAGEHLADTFAAPDLHSHLDAIPRPTAEVHHDALAAIPRPVEVHTAPEMPHTALTPNVGHLYHPVAANETLWGHTESVFDKELRTHFITGHDRDLVLENLRARLIAHPELAKEIGISSGNPDRIEYSHVVGITGEMVKGDTIDDTLLGKLVNEEIAKLAAKVGTPMEQATGTRIAVGMPASEGSVFDVPSNNAALRGAPPTPGDVPSVQPSKLDLAHVQPIPLPESNTPYISIDIPKPTIPAPISIAPETGVGAGIGALGAGVLSAQENSRVIGRAPKPAEVQQRKQDIIRLIEKQKPASGFGRLFGGFSPIETTPTPYEVLKNMSVKAIAETLGTKTNETVAEKSARMTRKTEFIRRNRVDASVFEHWMDNFDRWKSIIIGTSESLAESMTFETLLEKISEYQLERGETLQRAS